MIFPSCSAKGFLNQNAEMDVNQKSRIFHPQSNPLLASFCIDRAKKRTAPPHCSDHCFLDFRTAPYCSSAAADAAEKDCGCRIFSYTYSSTSLVLYYNRLYIERVETVQLAI